MSTPVIIRKKVQYGSLAYKILNYARFRSRQGDGTFSSAEYQEFRFKSVRPSYVQRAINSLVRNGHLQKVGENRFRFTDTNVLPELDLLYKDTLWDKTKNNRNRHNKYLQELRDIQSDDF